MSLVSAVLDPKTPDLGVTVESTWGKYQALIRVLKGDGVAGTVSRVVETPDGATCRNLPGMDNIRREALRTLGKEPGRG